MDDHDPYLDRPVWEGEGIARAIGMVRPDGTVTSKERSRIYDMIKRGVLDADRSGKFLWSTPRRLLRSLANKTP
jgi:hypothetical protein